MPGYTDLNAQEQETDTSDNEDDNPIESLDLQDSLLLVSDHDTCVSHTLQLVVKDCFKAGSSGKGDYKVLLAKEINK